jgi:hypothetical protein
MVFAGVRHAHPPARAVRTVKSGRKTVLTAFFRVFCRFWPDAPAMRVHCIRIAYGMLSFSFSFSIYYKACPDDKGDKVLEK